MMRTWADNADEFRALTKQGKDLRLAILVACSVEVKQPRKRKHEGGKVSAKEFAARCGTSHQRIMRHLDAWNRLASDGLCESSTNLQPHMVNDVRIHGELSQAWQAERFNVPAEAIAEIRASRSEAATRPRLRVVSDDGLETLRMLLAPAVRSAAMVETNLGNLRSESDRQAFSADLADVAAQFDAMAKAIRKRHTA